MEKVGNGSQFRSNNSENFPCEIFLHFSFNNKRQKIEFNNPKKILWRVRS